MPKRSSLTDEQSRKVRQNLLHMKKRLSEITGLLRAAYGDNSPAAVRADEAAAAIQRLEWELDRVAPQTRGQ